MQCLPILKLINEKAFAWNENNSYKEIISVDIQQVLAYQIAIQYLRMPNIHDKYACFLTKNYQSPG